MLPRLRRIREVAPERAVQRGIRVVRSGHDRPRARQVLMVMVMVSLRRVGLAVLLDAEQVLRRGRGGRLRCGGGERAGEGRAVLAGRWHLRCGGRVGDARVDGARDADRGGREEVRARDGDEDLARERVERGAVGERFARGAADEGLQGPVSVEDLRRRKRRTSGFLWYMLPRVPVCRSSWSRAPRSMRSASVVIAGFSARTTSLAALGLSASRRQYMNPRSRRSGLSTSSVAHLSTLCTSAFVVSLCDL